MKKLLILLSVAALSLGTSSVADTFKSGICNSNCQDNGKKKGWEEDPDNPRGNIPRGLHVSGDKGRVDNGKGNGGENIEGTTPTYGGEDYGPWEDDPH